MTFVLAIATAIQRVKVVNWPSPAPVPMPTPDPVVVSAMHAAWWTFAVTVAALIAAIVAAIKAFQAVNLARSDANTNSQSLALVQKQYNILAAQVMDQTRHPSLKVRFDTGQGMRVKAATSEEAYNHDATRKFQLLVRNDGDKKTASVTAHIMVKAEICQRLAGSSATELLNGTSYRSAHVSNFDVLPAKSGWRRLYEGWMTLDPLDEGDQFDFLVKLRDEYGNTYPETTSGPFFEYTAMLVEVESSGEITLESITFQDD